MNVERINALADLIEVQPLTDRSYSHGFNMGDYLHDCGTPSCMAGWAAWEACGRPAEGVPVPSGYDPMFIVVEKAHEWLETPPSMKTLFENELFRGNYSYWESEDITPAQAARVLRHLANTGTVDWSIIEAEIEEGSRPVSSPHNEH